MCVCVCACACACTYMCMCVHHVLMGMLIMNKLDIISHVILLIIDVSLVWTGSSAGAGSGDFHVYRGVRRREYARQKFIAEMAKLVCVTLTLPHLVIIYK